MLRLTLLSFIVGTALFAQNTNPNQSGTTKDSHIIFVPAQASKKLQSGALFAKCHIEPRSLSQVRGLVWFTQTKDGVLIVAEIEGLTPGPHGFFIHEFGDCSAIDASTAGGIFNPTGKKHGAPDSPERKIGDLGNIQADNSGYAYYQRLDKQVSLNGPNSIVGKSMIVHQNVDDFTTQPAGNSGMRVGCGEIFELAVD